jgi:hypothetical protein
VNPYVLEVELARGNAIRFKARAIKICRGTEKGCKGDARPSRCADCYRVATDDPRSSEQILADMARGDA